jgi:hypothetical protein
MGKMFLYNLKILAIKMLIVCWNVTKTIIACKYFRLEYAIYYVFNLVQVQWWYTRDSIRGPCWFIGLHTNNKKENVWNQICVFRRRRSEWKILRRWISRWLILIGNIYYRYDKNLLQAALGIAEMIVRQMQNEGLAFEEACSKIYMLDING